MLNLTSLRRLVSGVAASFTVAFCLLLTSCGGSTSAPAAELKQPDAEPAPTSCFLEEIEDEYGMMVEVETCE